VSHNFPDKFKRNLGGWYYFVPKAWQYKALYFKKLGIAAKYVSLMYPEYASSEIGTQRPHNSRMDDENN
jgi:hypothetical protein